MSQELSKQVLAKKELKQQLKDADRNGYLEGLKLMDQRMAQAEMNREHLK